MASSGHTIAVPLLRRDERRQAERYVAAMPVNVDGKESTTQDLSSTGLSFVSEQPYELGARIDVVIEYLLDGHHYPLHCQAEVMRVQRCDEGYTIGARLAPQSEVQDVALGESVAGAAADRQHLRSVD